ncbi:MAG: immunoglobulin domain-containing protein [Limisphaerales bacterium]
MTFNDVAEASGVVTNHDNPNDQQNHSFIASYLHYNGGPPVSGAEPLFFSPLFANINPANPEAILNLPPAGTGVPNQNAYAPSNQIYLYNTCDLIISNSFWGTNGNSAFGTNLSVFFSDYYNPLGPLILVTNDLQWYTPTATNIVISTNLTTHKTLTNTTISYLTNCYYSFVTNVTFYDFREGKTVQAIQFDVSKFNLWVTNAAIDAHGNYTGGNPWNYRDGGSDGAHGDKGHVIDTVFLYNNVQFSSSQLPAVRVVNGQQLPSPKGLTIATPMPIYVLGNYNIQTNVGGTQSFGTTNTAWTWPAALMGDAITVLSGNWNDTNSACQIGGSLNSRNTTNFTVNAACLAGIVISTNIGGVKHYSGGFENFLRLEENWSTTLCFNGSIVAMFPSIYATNYWQPTGNYYNPPQRNWGFDLNFLNSALLPPLTPLIMDTNPPVITSQPTNLVVLAGNPGVFSVTASGSLPLIYQWSVNGTNIDGATNVSLSLINVQPDQAGDYAVQVTNVFGSTMSSNAVLSVYASAAATLNGCSFSCVNGVQFQVAGVPGFNYAVQESTNLIDWVSLVTNTSPFIFVDANATNFPQLFYRSLYVP